MTKVTIEQGALLGGKSSTESGFQYIEFLQIPYAQPPVGELRFKSPQSPEQWVGERDATFADQNCVSIQINLITQKLRGSEDCLYLNVFTPQLPLPGSSPLPVMVYIHGGGFFEGNGTVKDGSGPDFLIQHGVVIVSINYRLGALGFLCLDLPEAAGNMGLKDQTMALKWIQKNIAQFGGDKNNVTIFGLSAGGASVEYLCLSSQTKGLLHKAIPQSGSALNHWAFNLNIKELSLKLAATLGCKTTDEKSVLDFLLRAPADAIATTAYNIVGISSLNKTYFGFVPTIELDFGNGDAFITEYPYNILKSKMFEDIPTMIGFSEFESLIISQLYKTRLNDFLDPKIFTHFYYHPVESPELLNAKFEKLYLTEYVKAEEDWPDQAMINFLSHLDFTSGIWISSLLKSIAQNHVYLYIFSYNNKNLFDDFALMLKNTGILSNTHKKRGAVHGDDLLYVIKQKMLGAKFSENDTLIMRRMSKMWTDFAKTGNPTPTTNELIPVKWPLFSFPELNYLKIDTELEISSKYVPNKMKMFEELYQKYRW